MSIRIKLLIAYLIIIIIGVIMMTIGLVKTTTNLLMSVKESTIGEHSVEEVTSAFMDVFVEMKYISKHEPSLIEDKDYLMGIEDKSMLYGLYFYIERDGTLTYLSQDENEISFSSFYQEVDFGNYTPKRSDSIGGSFLGTTHEYNKLEYTIFRSDLAENMGQGHVYLLLRNKDLSKVETKIFIDLIRDILLGTGIILLLLTIIITYLIIKPLKVLKEATMKIGHEELDFSIKTNRRDEIGEVTNAFDTMREELKKSIEQKSQYEANRKELLASISHDLKTPITSIKGYVEGIRDGIAKDEAKMDQYLEVIHQKSIDLDQMIDDLFLFSKLDLHRLPFDYIKMDINRFFDDCYNEMEVDLEKEGFSLNYDNQIRELLMVKIDPQQIKRVIVNIISNAMKYSGERKEVVMSVTTHSNNVRLLIEDFGKGIKKENLDQIFDKFYRCDPSRNSEIKGSGLGLAIAKQIIESHGGRIWAESEVGHGTKIFIELERV